MARIRTIKPSFFTDAKICRLSVHARLLFIATWTIADDTDGVFDARLSILKTAAFLEDPFSPEDIARWFAELTGLGLVWTFEDQGVPYGVVRHWGRHQVISKPAKKANPNPPPEPKETPIPEIPRNPQESPGKSREERKGKEEERNTPGDGAPGKPWGSSPVSQEEGEFLEYLRAKALQRNPKIPYKIPYPKGEVFALHGLRNSGVSWDRLRAIVNRAGVSYRADKIVTAGYVLNQLPSLVSEFDKATGPPGDDRSEYLPGNYSDHVISEEPAE